MISNPQLTLATSSIWLQVLSHTALTCRPSNGGRVVEGCDSRQSLCKDILYWNLSMVFGLEAQKWTPSGPVEDLAEVTRTACQAPCFHRTQIIEFNWHKPAHVGRCRLGAMVTLQTPSLKSYRSNARITRVFECILWKDTVR